MSIFLPIAGVSLNLFLLVGVGAAVGFLSGLLGVGGGFLLTPTLMMIGIHPTVAAASDSCQIVAASSSGVSAHFRLGNVDLKMGVILLLGGLVGGTLGVDLIRVLRVLGEADLLISLAYIVMLGGTGGYMFLDSVRNLRRGAIVSKPTHRRGRSGLVSRLPFQMEFPRSGVRHSVLVPFLLSVLVGLLAAVMGVGGGFIIVPMMVYLLGMPMHVAVGTSLFQILVVCSWVTFAQARVNQTVDLTLALLLAVGSTMGAQIGARLNHVLRGEQLMILLASLALLVGVKMVVGLVRTPRSLLSEAAVVQPVARQLSRAIPGRNSGRNSLSRSLAQAVRAAADRGQPIRKGIRCSYSYP